PTCSEKFYWFRPTAYRSGRSAGSVKGECRSCPDSPRRAERATQAGLKLDRDRRDPNFRISSTPIRDRVLFSEARFRLLDINGNTRVRVARRSAEILHRP